MKIMRNKIKKIFLILPATLMLLTGCDKFLTQDLDSYIEPEKFYSTKTEVEIGLAGIYGVLGDDNVFGQSAIAFDCGADEGYYNRRSNESWAVSLYRHTAADGQIKVFWKSLYEAINLSNLFIKNLKKSAFTEEEYNRYLAEARFLRAFCYLNLTNWFEQVPLRTEPTKNQKSNHVPAAKLEDIYDFISKDLLAASKHLLHANDSQYVPGRANKMAAHALLARMYLKQAGYPLRDASAYEKALLHCDTIINVDGWHGLTTAEGNGGYRKHFLSYIQNNYDYKESLFEISFSFLRTMGITTDGRVGGINGLRFWLAGGLEGPSSYSLTNASPVLLNAYDDNDKRKEWNVPGVMYNNGNAARQSVLQDFFCPGKFRRWEPVSEADLDVNPPTGQNEKYVVLEKSAAFSPNFTSVNYPVMRYADVLLMYAEAENQLNGPTQKAKDALDLVRVRAGLGKIEIDKPSAVASKESFFNELVDERMRELCFEGIRRHDLVRWGLLESRLKLLNQVIKGTPGFLPTSDQHVSYLRSSVNFNPAKHLSLPYPLQEITINNKLKQKPEWSGAN